MLNDAVSFPSAGLDQTQSRREEILAHQVRCVGGEQARPLPAGLEVRPELVN